MLEAGCHRSHPHEDMDAICKLKTENAHLQACNAQLHEALAHGHRIRVSILQERDQLKAELAQAKEALAYIGSGDATSLTEAEAVARHILTKLKEGA